MAKARKEEDGSIKVYGTLPSKFRGQTGNYAGGFHLMDEEIIRTEGFYDLVIPEYNHFTEILGQIFFDENEKFFTYEVNIKPDLPSIEEAKRNKIDELKKLARNKFNETDWYYIRELHSQKNNNKKVLKFVPEEVIEEREWIYGVVEYKEAEINLLEDLESVLAYEVNLEVDMSMIEKKAEEILPEEVLSEENLVEEIPTEQVPAEEAPTEQISVEETPAEETPVEETPVEETPVEETPVEETPVEETPVEETLVEETPVEETLVEETPVEETPVEETPVEETPTEETPTEQTQTEEKVIDIEKIKEELNNIDQTNEVTEEASSFVEEEKDTPLETITETVSEIISKIKKPVSLAISQRNKKRSVDGFSKKKTKNKIVKLNTQTKNKNNLKKISSKTRKPRA